MNDMKIFVCVLMIYVCINSGEIHIVGFFGGFLCMIPYGCIFLCIVAWDCRQNGVTRGGVFG